MSSKLPYSLRHLSSSPVLFLTNFNLALFWLSLGLFAV